MRRRRHWRGQRGGSGSGGAARIMNIIIIDYHHQASDCTRTTQTQRTNDIRSSLIRRYWEIQRWNQGRWSIYTDRHVSAILTTLNRQMIRLTRAPSSWTRAAYSHSDHQLSCIKPRSEVVEGGSRTAVQRSWARREYEVVTGRPGRLARTYVYSCRNLT